PRLSLRGIFTYFSVDNNKGDSHSKVVCTVDSLHNMDILHNTDNPKAGRQPMPQQLDHLINLLQMDQFHHIIVHYGMVGALLLADLFYQRPGGNIPLLLVTS